MKVEMKKFEVKKQKRKTKRKQLGQKNYINQ